jgi:molybdopterin/thiamine biosynthesis adenylyltransferase
MEAIKVLLGLPDTLTGSVLYFDASTMDFEKVGLRRDPNCPLCGQMD